MREAQPAPVTAEVAARRFGVVSSAAAAVLVVLALLLAAASVPLYAMTHQNWYVLRVPSTFYLTVACGVRLTCKNAAARLPAAGRCWEVRSAGNGSKGRRWYAWA
ncbi:MAG TPA: hypothetical protein VGS06_45030 [Streptosporangiaceae bacterium]|nr:hypothetical protein [Streptosporangiaceae bacterium]